MLPFVVTQNDRALLPDPLVIVAAQVDVAARALGLFAGFNSEPVAALDPLDDSAKAATPRTATAAATAYL
jgi:hypothetical protein